MPGSVTDTKGSGDFGPIPDPYYMSGEEFNPIQFAERMSEVGGRAIGRGLYELEGGKSAIEESGLKFGGSLMRLVILGAFVSVLWGLFYLLRWLARPFRGKFLIGGVASLLDRLGAHLHPAFLWIVNELGVVCHHILRNMIDLISFALAVLGIPSLGYVHSQIHRRVAPLARQPSDVGAYGNRIVKSINKHLIRVDVEIKTLDHRVHNVAVRVGNLTKDVHVHTLRIRKLNKEYNTLHKGQQHLQKEYNNLNHKYNNLHKELKNYESRLLKNEHVLEPVALGAAVGMLLGPLVATGPEGVANLADEARDPCRCFSIPGSMGAILWGAVMYLLEEDLP